MLVSLLLLLSLPHRLPSDVPPRLLLRQVQRAVESGRAGPVQAEWRRRLVRDSTDRVALLALACLARLTYDYAEADRLYDRIRGSSNTTPDAVSVYARVDQATAWLARGMMARSDSLYSLAALEARAIGERNAETKAKIYRVAPQSRIVGPEAALRALDSISPLRRPDERDQEAERRCRRAGLLVVLARPGARAEAVAGAHVAQVAGEPRIQAACLHWLARDLQREGRTDSALRVLRKVTALQEAALDRQGLAVILQWRGFLEVSIGEYASAREHLLQSAAEGRASASLSPAAWANLNLAGISLLMSDVTAGLRYVASAESLFANTGDRLGLATLVGYKGSLMRLDGDFAGARTAYRTALANTEKLSGDFAMSFHRALADLAMSRGDLATAASELDTTRVKARELGMRGYDNGLEMEFGLLAMKRGDSEAAEQAFTRHLQAMGRQPGRRFPAQVRMAQVLARRGDLAGGERELTAAMDSLESWRASLRDQELRLMVFDVRGEDFEPDLGQTDVLGRMVAGGRAATAFELAERRRARELLDNVVRVQAFGNSPAGVRATPDTLRRPFAHTRVEDVQSAIPDAATAVLEYVAGAGGDPSILFVLTRTEFHGYLLPPADSVASDIERFQVLIQSGGAPRDLGAGLGRVLLGPALRELPASITRLVVVADGPIHHVPFDALALPDGRLVVERFAVGSTPSAAIAVRLWKRPAHAGPLAILAFGSPLLGRSSRAPPLAEYRRDTREIQATFAASGGLPPLPSSAKEARMVAGFASLSELRLGERASEAWLKRTSLRRYSVLHFAAHAMVDERAPTHTALALAAGDGEDGFVTPADLATLSLDADLVVLSACRTAGGVVVGGEGVLGLTAPLVQAGARSVVATGWSVGDESAVAFVQSFYETLAEGHDVAEALRMAKLSAIRRGLPMSLWAAFTLIGNPTVRIPLRQRPHRTT